MATKPKRRPKKDWTLPCDGRLTTRRVDALTRLEVGILSFAAKTGGAVVVHGHSSAEHVEACHFLQRIGYLIPVGRARFVDEADLPHFVLPALANPRPDSLIGLHVEAYSAQPSTFLALREVARRITEGIMPSGA